MKMTQLIITAGTLLSALLPFSSDAATDTTSFQVKLTITSTCDIHSVSANDVDFGSHLSTDSTITAQGGLAVNCTNGTPYDIGLNDGDHLNGGHRNMTNSQASEMVGYELYRDAGMSQTWGDTIGTDTLHSTGTGTSQSIPVYGQVLTSGANLKAGDYLDNVVATVTY